MNKSNLIEKFAVRNGLLLKEAESIVNTFWDRITEGLSQGERVEIRGFGSFKVKRYDGYNGRNPKSGEIVEVKPKKLPFFKPGKALKDQVDY